MSRRLGVFGGTFDPVHYGHLDAAGAARAALGLDEVLFVPSKDPPHRPALPHATAYHRFALVALALNGLAGYRVSDMELRRNGRSYTSDTLRDLHTAGWAASQLFFITGADAFAEIATWHEYPTVLDLAHFVVIARPGTTIDAAVSKAPELRSRVRPATLGDANEPRTSIFVVDAATRDVSSTMIRERLEAGHPIEGLVPSPVAKHIVEHHLYRTEGDLHGEDEDQRR